MFIINGEEIGWCAMAEDVKEEPKHHVLHAEQGKFEVSVDLVTSLSTTSNAHFEKIVHSFAHRMNEKSAEIFGGKIVDHSSSKSSE
jgi:hypothetical protein